MPSSGFFFHFVFFFSFAIISSAVLWLLIQSVVQFQTFGINLNNSYLKGFIYMDLYCSDCLPYVYWLDLILLFCVVVICHHVRLFEKRISLAYLYGYWFWAISRDVRTQAWCSCCLQVFSIGWDPHDCFCIAPCYYPFDSFFYSIFF